MGQSWRGGKSRHSTPIHFEDIAGKGAKAADLESVSPLEQLGLMPRDADITLPLHQTLWAKLSKPSRAWPKGCCAKIENEPLVTVLARIERLRGAGRCPSCWASRAIELVDKMIAAQREASRMAGEGSNLVQHKAVGYAFCMKSKAVPVNLQTAKASHRRRGSAGPELAEQGLIRYLQVIMQFAP